MHVRHLVCTDAFAGVERYLTYVAVELARRGHRVEVVGGHPDSMAEALAPAGATHIAASSLGSVMRANLRLPRPDVVHSHMTAADLAAVFTRPYVRRPIIATMHFAHGRGHSPTTRRLYRALPPFLAAEVAISDYVGANAGSGLTVIRTGIPDPGSPPPFVEREQVVVIAQRLEAEKDTAAAVRAWQRSGIGERGWTLQILGDGAERRALTDLAAAVGVTGSVDFLGHVDDVPARLRRASLLLATTPTEGFGLTVVEAMAAGLPVIATDSGAHPETVGAATPETLVPLGDIEAMAKLLTDLADDPERRATLGQDVRSHFLAELTVERHVDRLEALYRHTTAD